MYDDVAEDSLDDLREEVKDRKTELKQMKIYTG